MHFLVLGAGRQAPAIIHDLLIQGGNAVAVIDRDQAALEALLKRFPGISVTRMDVNELGLLAPMMKGVDVCISAAPYFYNFVLARTAVENGVHFCDLGGNTQIVLKELRLDGQARENGVVVIPDCGLSPGVTNILAAHAIARLTEVETLEIRVGGLPLNPVPPFNYLAVFSVQGLLNEYVEPAVIVEGGIYRRVESMTGVEPIVFEGYPEFEAFYTYGGLSTLPETYSGRVRNLNDKTIRYPGHAALMRHILKDPKFKSRGEIRAYLESTLPKEGSDVVLARVRATGPGRTRQATLEVVDVADPKSGFSAMMRTAGFSVAIVAEMIAAGKIAPGAHVQEKVIPTDEFIFELGKRGIHVRQSLSEVTQ